MIESVQSLGMDNYRVAFTRFLAFYSDNLSGLCDGETPSKWQSKASFATHPSTETEWPPKILTRFSSGRIGAIAEYPAARVHKSLATAVPRCRGR